MNQLHESYLKDIFDLVSDIRDGLKSDNLKNKKNSMKSISKTSSALTLTYPVICPKSLGVSTDAMVAKGVEMNAIQMLQLIFAANQIIDFGQFGGAEEFVQKYHRNLDFNTVSVDDALAVADKIKSVSEAAGFIVEEGFNLTEEELNKLVLEDMKTLDDVFEPSISESGLDRFYTKNGMLLEDTDYNKLRYELDREKFAHQQEMDHKRNQVQSNKNDNDAINRMNDIEARRQKDAIDNSRKDAEFAYKVGRDQKEDDRKSMEFAYKQQMDAVKNANDAIKVAQLLPAKVNNDMDVKKINDVLATTMTVTINAMLPNNTTVPFTFYIAVKARIYLVNSTDMVERILNKNKDKNFFGNIIRAFTREISWFKDLVFAVDQAKVDAIASSNKGSSSKIWKVLERRSMKSGIKRILGKQNDAMAITTLVLSQEEVELLKKVNVDMTKPSVARGIMESYNVMCIMLADEVNEIISVLYDTGDDIYETYAFGAFEKQNNDTSYKKIVNLMTKVSR